MAPPAEAAKSAAPAPKAAPAEPKAKPKRARQKIPGPWRIADAKGDLSGSNAIVWSLDRDTPYVPSPLLYDNILYFLKTNNGLLSAYDAASGKLFCRPYPTAVKPRSCFPRRCIGSLKC